MRLRLAVLATNNVLHLGAIEAAPTNVVLNKQAHRRLNEKNTENLTYLPTEAHKFVTIYNFVYINIIDLNATKKCLSEVTIRVSELAVLWAVVAAAVP